jgi:hypothetical protein
MHVTMYWRLAVAICLALPLLDVVQGVLANPICVQGGPSVSEFQAVDPLSDSSARSPVVDLPRSMTLATNSPTYDKYMIQ